MPSILRSGFTLVEFDGQGCVDFFQEGEGLVHEPFNRLIKGEHLMVYEHDGFWTMDATGHGGPT